MKEVSFHKPSTSFTATTRMITRMTVKETIIGGRSRHHALQHSVHSKVLFAWRISLCAVKMGLWRVVACHFEQRSEQSPLQSRGQQGSGLMSCPLLSEVILAVCVFGGVRMETGSGGGRRFSTFFSFSFSFCIFVHYFFSRQTLCGHETKSLLRLAATMSRPT